MTLHKVFDAAFPPNEAPPGAEGVLIYIGLHGFTPHVWTTEECLRFQHLRQFPTWLPDKGANPLVDAANAVATAKRYGWAAHHSPLSTERLLLCDVETSEIPAWYDTWSRVVNSAGFMPYDYGSLSNVLANAAYDVWAADWNGIPKLIPGETIHGDQYKAGILWEGTRIDLSVVDDSLFNRGGVGPRHQV